MNNVSLESKSGELKNLLLKTKKELKNKNDALKQAKNIQDLTKKEYQTLLNENSKLKKKKLKNTKAITNLNKLKNGEKKETILKSKKKNLNVEEKKIFQC